MKKHNIDIICIEDKEYPSLLKEINNPPICIYIIGKKDILNDPNIAIAGVPAKKISDNGRYKWNRKD